MKERDDLGSAPLDSYAAIGDGRTVALIARDGDVDWLPVPDLSSPPAFAALLDPQHGGRVSLRPVEEFTVRRRYVKGTNVLQTTFTTEHGKVRVTDAMVTGVAGRMPWAELARRVDGLEGAVEMRWSIEPGTMLNDRSPWLEQFDGSAVIRLGDTSIAVTGLRHMDEGEPESDPKDASIRGSFTTTEGTRHLVIVAATADEPLHMPDPQNVDRGIDRTIDNWRLWSKEFSYDGPWADQVQRSALALKLLVHASSGAIAAAATTSLPERPQGGKNWDYRYAWVRDLAYTVRALVRFGLREETHAALSWLLKAIKVNGPDLHVMYDLDGGLAGEVHEHDVPGWRGIQPVVSGNPATDQLQLGVFGDLFEIARLYVDVGNVLDIETGRLLAGIADATCDLWRHPDSGMWELGEIRHYTSSKMGCWQALDSAVALAERGAIPGSAERWRAERERITEWIHENCIDERGVYTMHPDTDDLDASVLLHGPSGFDRGDTMVRTIDAVRDELGAGPLLYRYSGMQGEEKTFLSCAFWVASALACVGRHDEAVALMDELVTIPNDVGIMSEMVDADDHSFWGNLPQALSHLALINSAITLHELAPEAVAGR